MSLPHSWEKVICKSHVGANEAALLNANPTVDTNSVLDPRVLAYRDIAVDEYALSKGNAWFQSGPFAEMAVVPHRHPFAERHVRLNYGRRMDKRS